MLASFPHNPDVASNNSNGELMTNEQAALGWKYDWFGNLEMVWVKVPDPSMIGQIARRELKVPDDSPYTVTFLAEGAFNKVYTVQCSADIRYIMRIPLPVQPHLKTLSEVATIEYVQHHTDIPVPKILSFDATHSNELGFEWMLMDYITGSKLEEQWRTMSWLKKEVLGRRIIASLAQLFKKRFNLLGNLYKTGDLQQLRSAVSVDIAGLYCEDSSPKNDFLLGNAVELPFFWGNNLKVEVNRGPFRNSHEWLHAILRLHLLAADNPIVVITDSDDESESDDEPDPLNIPAAIKNRIQRLMNLLPKFFPAEDSEEFVLHHHDLHQNNVFVGENHELSSIIDWEYLPTVPLWAACEFPKFLQTKLNRHLCPNPEKYMKEVLDDGTEELNAMYYEHLAEYEKTQLRAFFLEQMQRDCPQGVEIYRNSKMKAAFGEVVAVLNDKSNSNIIDEWLDTVEEHGSAPSIGNTLHAYEQELLDCDVASLSRKT